MKARPKLRSGRFGHGFPSQRDEGVLDASGIRAESVRWDFDQDTGATGSYSFSRRLPAGAIITRVFTDEITNITSGGAATVQLKAGATDITDALDAVAGVDGPEQHPLAGAVEAIKISEDSVLTMEIATADLTAGSLRWFVEYLMPNDE